MTLVASVSLACRLPAYCVASALSLVALACSNVSGVEESVGAKGLCEGREGVGAYFGDSQFLNSHLGFAITRNQLWKTVDGGTSWNAIFESPPIKGLAAPTRMGLDRIQFLNELTGFSEMGSSLLRTKNGGETWESLKPADMVIRSFRFVTAEIGWIGGSINDPRTDKTLPAVQMTTNGGSDWQVVYSNPQRDGTVWDVWPLSPSDVWVVDGLLKRTRDRGETWKTVELPKEGVSGIPASIRFNGSHLGWVIMKGGGAAITSDGGETWTPLAAIGPLAGLLDLVYVTPDQLWAIVGRVPGFTVILRSDDRGRSWRQITIGPYSRLAIVDDNSAVVAFGERITICR